MLKRTITSLLGGLRLTWRHLRRGGRRRTMGSIESENYFDTQQQTVTIQYPLEQISIPDTGRYRLHMETDDCIVCDKCVRICPVDCIDIESFKATEDLGHTSDGSRKRLHLPVFDIDMAKCCYCGLCTTVCPTECLTMTKVYDFSEYDRSNFIYHFGAMSPEEAKEKRAVLAVQEAEKKRQAELAKAEAAKKKAEAAEGSTGDEDVPKKKPILRKKKLPKLKPKIKRKDDSSSPD